jgi:hypothetical protein
MFSRKLLLLLAALGSAGPVLAQRPAVAPLAPAVVPVAAPQPLGVGSTSRPPAQSAAPAFDQPSRTSRPQPVYIINGSTIIGGGLAQLNPQDIADLQVYKDNSARVPANWRRLTANGIIAITLKPHVKPTIKTESLAAIGRGLKLRGPVSYQLDGQPLEDLSLRIATADIVGLDAQPTASGTVVNIRLTLPPPAVHPPGTIMLRGASGS